MTYTVKLDVFEGPLDLLCHLIEKDEVDIYDIPIARIAEQYLDYLAQMQEMNLDLAGEFLVMAATLLEIKAKMLLPKVSVEEGDAAGEETDPREELVAQLLEYKKFKAISRLLQERLEENSLAFSRPPSVGVFQAAGSAALDGLVPGSLWEAFRAVLARAAAVEPELALPRDEFTIGDKIARIMDRLARKASVSFGQLFTGATNREEIIVTFLALLELVRRRSVRIVQPSAFGEITVTRASNLS
jgi:segregation and condensation protein A